MKSFCSISFWPVWRWRLWSARRRWRPRAALIQKSQKIQTKFFRFRTFFLFSKIYQFIKKTWWAKIFQTSRLFREKLRIREKLQISKLINYFREFAVIPEFSVSQKTADFKKNSRISPKKFLNFEICIFSRICSNSRIRSFFVFRKTSKSVFSRLYSSFSRKYALSGSDH